MTAFRRLPLVVVLAVASAGGAAPRAFAAGTDTTRMRDARAHYEQAVANYNLDEFAPALAEFREAYRLKPDPSFLFNIAQCHRKLGEADAALDFYRKYLRSLPNAPNRADVERIVADLRARQTSTPAVAAPPPPPPALAAPPAIAPPAPPPAAVETTPAPRADVLVATPAPEAPRAPTPIYQRWWFWTGLGAVVVGAVVAGVALSRPAAQPYQGTLGPPAIEVR